VVGIISLMVLAVGIPARTCFISPAHGVGFMWSGPLWRSTLTSFVAVVQAFLKVPALKARAPTQKEPPVLVAQLAVMALFILLGIFG